MCVQCLWCEGWLWDECQSHLFPGYASHYPLDRQAEVLEDLKPVQLPWEDAEGCVACEGGQAGWMAATL